MNISEVRTLVEGARYEEKITILEDISERVGDGPEIGYLGSSVSNISIAASLVETSSNVISFL